VAARTAVGPSRHRGTQRPRQPLQDRGLQQEDAQRLGLAVQHLLGQVIEDEAVAAGEPGHEGADVVVAPQQQGGQLLDDRFEPTWVILAGAVALLAYGLLRGAGRPGHGLPLQTAGLVGFGAAAAAALMITAAFGAWLVAAGLLGHAAWDAYHHRVNRVVVRSLAEFCLVLDTALAVAIVIVTVLQ
jgi:hypothetical protein